MKKTDLKKTKKHRISSDCKTIGKNRDVKHTSRVFNLVFVADELFTYTAASEVL